MHRLALIIPAGFVLAMFGVIDLDDTQTNLAAVDSPLAAANAPASPPSHGWVEAGAWIALPAFVTLAIMFAIKKAGTR